MSENAVFKRYFKNDFPSAFNQHSNLFFRFDNFPTVFQNWNVKRVYRTVVVVSTLNRRQSPRVIQNVDDVSIIKFDNEVKA